MQFVADILLVTGAIGVAFYCFTLSRRLSRFTNLEQGVGGAVAVLSAQVDDLTKALEAARAASTESEASLGDLTTRAEDVARRLELNIASLHDLPAYGAEPPAEAFEAPEAEEEAEDAPDGLQDDAPIVAPPTQSFFASHRGAPELAS